MNDSTANDSVVNARRTRRIAREKLLHQITGALTNDERFVAAWLIGSLGRGAGDDLSDLDLVVVVDAKYAETLCRRPWLVAGRTTDERYALFAQFGEPTIIHENHYNAPNAGTFTSVTYSGDALTVDWTLLPQEGVILPISARVLVNKVNLPVKENCPRTQEEQAADASEKIAFFWMMMVVTAKYMLRNDPVYFHILLHTLHRSLSEVSHLIEGNEWVYRSGSEAKLVVSQRGQQAVLQQLSVQMQTLMPKVVALGGYVPNDPMSAVETLLKLSTTGHHADLVEYADRWVIPAAGFQVGGITVGAFEVYLDGANQRIVLRMGSTLLFREGDVDYQIDVGDMSQICKVFSIVGQSVVNCVALKNGELHVNFAENVKMVVKPLDKVEAWELYEVAPDLTGFRIICMPGGDLAVWTKRPS